MLKPSQVKPKTIELVCVPIKHTALRRRARIGWLGIRIMCPSGAKCLFSEYTL